MSNNKNNKKYDIDSLLREALSVNKTETPDAALIENVGATLCGRPQTTNINESQTAVGYAGIPLPPSTSLTPPAKREAKGASRRRLDFADFRRFMNTAAVVVVTAAFIAAAAFAAYYMRGIAPYDVGTDATDATASTRAGNDDDFGAAFQKLSEINSDLYGWIQVNGTPINYPVVQTYNNEFYLTHGFDKERSRSGAIFADYINSRDIGENRHLVLYGFNMLDGSMFAPLLNFETDKELFNNGVIEISAEDGTIYYYEIFSVREEDPRSGYIQTQFDSDEEYAEFLNVIKNRSVFQKDINLDENSKIITLSTVKNDPNLDMRFAVSGVLTYVQKPMEELNELKEIEETATTESSADVFEPLFNLIDVEFGYGLRGDYPDITYAEVMLINFKFDGLYEEFSVSDLTDLKLIINGKATAFTLFDFPDTYDLEYTDGKSIHGAFILDGNGTGNTHVNNTHVRGIILDAIPSTIQLSCNYKGAPFVSEEKTSPENMQLRGEFSPDYWRSHSPQELYAINLDFYGWIRVLNTTIDYPVVQTTDNEYYLRHDFSKRYNPAGAIFVDCRNSRDISENRNTVIFGHNMLDNSIFQPLIRFGADENLFSDSVIALTAEKETYYEDARTYYYEIFSVYEDNPDLSGGSMQYMQSELATKIDFATDEEYVAFLNETKSRSVFQKDVTLDANSKIITLVTCVNDVTLNMRFVVQGVLVDVKY